MFQSLHHRRRTISSHFLKITPVIVLLSVLLGTWSTLFAQEEVGPLVPPLVVTQLTFPAYEE